MSTPLQSLSLDSQSSVSIEGRSGRRPRNPITTRDPSNYRAWFDLGFVYNGQGKTDESIAAYRKAVVAKPDVFESNLNLGLMLAKTKQAMQNNICAPPHS